MADDTVRRSVTADRLIDELDRLATVRGYPAVLHCDRPGSPAPAEAPRRESPDWFSGG